MYLKCSVRRKDGKEHRSWQIVRSRRLRDGRCIQRHVLYLGEITGSQRETWQKSLDKLLEHKMALFSHMQGVWRDLFNARCDALLYDLTSTYFEYDVPEREGLRRFGYSRDKRPDCVQVVIALIVTPEGFPLGYEEVERRHAPATVENAVAALA